MAVSFDLFGTLVAAERPASPSAAVAASLSAQGISVPAEWDSVYSEPHIDVQPGAELSLPVHVDAALESCGITASQERVRRAVLDAFDAEVRTRPGAVDAVAVAARLGPVGVLSNCSVPGLVARVLERSAFESEQFDAVVTSVDCGWRKPDRRAFEAIATALDVPLSALVHVGDDPATDGGADEVGATALLLDDVPLSDIPTAIEQREDE